MHYDQPCNHVHVIHSFRDNKKENQRNLNKNFLKTIDDMEIESVDGGTSI